MRLKLLIPLIGALALTIACLQASAAPPARRAKTASSTPAIAAKKAQAARVLDEISTIDERLNTVSERFDGARLRLAALRRNLRAGRSQLTHARARDRVAEQRAAKFLVWLYTEHRSDALDVILGARNLSQMLSLSEDEDAISQKEASVTHEALQAKATLDARVRALDRDRRTAQATVNELAHERSRIEDGLAERRRLLVSVQTEVNRLEAQQLAQQERLAAQAEARLAAEQRERAQAEAEAAAAARAEAAAKSKAEAAAARRAERQVTETATTDPGSTSTAATTTTATATTTTTPAVDPGQDADTTGTADTATTAPSPSTTATVSPAVPASPVPAGPLPPGHPEAAQIALRYLGIKYTWGGASPSTGFDCSGLVTYVYAQLGIALPHFAAAQWDYGVPVPESELEPGDLVFFDALNHVGIYLGDNEIINAPHTGSFVRIDSLSEPWYADHYVGARRL